MITLTTKEFLEAIAIFIEKRDKIKLDQKSMQVDKVSENAYEFIVSDKNH